MNKTISYELQTDQGRLISIHDNYDDAVEAAEEYAGADGVVGHDGDLSEGGDRTLVWADDESAANDAGAKAIGCIRSQAMYGRS